MTLKCDPTKRDAGNPATGPKAAETTGTSFKVKATDLNLDLAKTGSPP